MRQPQHGHLVIVVRGVQRPEPVLQGDVNIDMGRAIAGNRCEQIVEEIIQQQRRNPYARKLQFLAVPLLLLLRPEQQQPHRPGHHVLGCAGVVHRR